MRPSMGSVGDAYDNAMAVSFFATLECEPIDRHRFNGQAEARIAVFTFIEGFYNPCRRHSSIGYLSPVAYEKSLLDPAARNPAIVLAPVEARPGNDGASFTTAVPAGLDRRSTRWSQPRAGRDEKTLSAEQKRWTKGGAMPSNLTPWSQTLNRPPIWGKSNAARANPEIQQLGLSPKATSSSILKFESYQAA